MKFAPAPGTLPDGVRVYAVGDVHGCLRQLTELHAMIAADLAARPVGDARIVHLGDYVDRGPDSAGVVALLACAATPAAAVNLMGNHERTMLDALDGDRAAATDWLYNGGRAALESWHTSPDADWRVWRAAIPPAHLAWIGALALMHRIGGYLFVHAGLRPGVPIAAQSPGDLLTIRTAFLASDARFGVVVVHGHTPDSAVVVRANRIGIDTGAVFGGKLTCAVLEADRMAFLQA